MVPSRAAAAHFDIGLVKALTLLLTNDLGCLSTYWDVFVAIGFHSLTLNMTVAPRDRHNLAGVAGVV